MTDATITLRDFSGGLNTTLDPTRLPPQMSSDLMNVEVLDSRSIRRRKGYQAETEPIGGGAEIRGIYRYYRADGSKSWAYLAATGLYVKGDATKTSYGKVQVESLAATSATYRNVRLSAAAAVPLTATTVTYTVPVPYSTYIKVAGGGDGFKVAVDGGAYSNSVSNAVTLAPLTATTHTLTIKSRGTVNASSIAIRGEAGKYSLRQKIGVVSVAAVGTYSMRFKLGAGGKPFCGLAIGTTGKGLYVGTLNGTTMSVYGGPSSGSVVPLTGVPVYATAWNEVVMDLSFSHGYNATLVSVNGVSVGGHEYAAGQYPLNPSLYSLEGIGYFDQIRKNHAMLDDCGSLTGWTRYAGSNSTQADYISSSIYDTRVFSLIDTVEYRADAEPVKITTMGQWRSLAAATLNGKMFFGGWDNAIRSYDGVTVSAITASGAAPAAQFLVEHKRRLFAAGKATDNSLLEYTAVDSGVNWTGGGALRATGKDSGGECTGLTTWSDLLWYFGHSRIHAIDTTGAEANWTNKAINTRFGCVAPKTLTRSPNGLIFLSNGAVRAYGTVPGVNSPDGSGLLTLSKNIKGTLDRVNWTSARWTACGAFYRDRYYLSLPLDGAGFNNYTLVYKFATEDAPESWTLYNYGFNILYTPRGDEDALYGGGNDGRVYRLEYGATDNGAPISLKYTIPPVSGDKQGSSTIKHFRRVHIAAEAASEQTLTVTPFTDDEAGQPVSLTVNPSTDSRPIRTPLNARGRSLGLILTGDGDDQDITISEVTLTHAGARMR